jgi:hypothetical protein
MKYGGVARLGSHSMSQIVRRCSTPLCGDRFPTLIDVQGPNHCSGHGPNLEAESPALRNGHITFHTELSGKGTSPSWDTYRPDGILRAYQASAERRSAHNLSHDGMFTAMIDFRCQPVNRLPGTKQILRQNRSYF